MSLTIGFPNTKFTTHLMYLVRSCGPPFVVLCRWSLMVRNLFGYCGGVGDGGGGHSQSGLGDIIGAFQINGSNSKSLL